MQFLGFQPKLPSTILQSKHKPKIQNLKKLHHVVTKKDTRGMANDDTLLPTKKVRWKDNAETITATKKNRNDLNRLSNLISLA